MSYKVTSNFYGPYVVKTILDTNWSLISGYPTPVPQVAIADDWDMNRLVSAYTNFFFCYQKSGAKDSSHATLNNQFYNSTYTVMVEIRAFNRTILINYYEHFKKCIRLSRKNPSTKHTTMYITSKRDESNKARNWWKLVITIQLLAQLENIS